MLPDNTITNRLGDSYAEDDPGVMVDHATLQFGASDDAGGSLPAALPRQDVLTYIHEMCSTLSYMSNAHECRHLANLLAAAANEADRCLSEHETTPQG